MTCNCSDGSVGVGASQRTLEAWVQVKGASLKNDVEYAMTGGGWPGIRVSQWDKKFRGSRTPINRRTYAHESKQCGAKEGAKPANTISIDVAACGCGDVDLVELMSCRTLDLYQAEICCEGQGGSFLTGWSKMRIWTNVTFDGVSSNANVTFDADEDESIVYTYPGDFTDTFTVYPLLFKEISSGFLAGSEMSDVSYGCGVCGSCAADSSCEGCVESWCSISPTGKMVYQQTAYEGPQMVSVTGWPADAVAGYVTLYNKYYWAIARRPNAADQIFKASCSSPSTWTEVTTLSIPSNFDSYGIECTRNHLLLYGNCGLSGMIFDVGNNQTLDKQDFCLPDDPCAMTFGGYRTIAICDKQLVLPTVDCNNTGSTTALAFRGSEVWSGDDSGAVKVSYDDGSTFTTVKTFPTGPGTIKGIAWANANVGYIVRQEADGSFGIYSTVNGGNLWSLNERLSLPTGATVNKIVVPCCRNNPTLNANRLLIAGSIKGRAAVWQGTPINC